MNKTKRKSNESTYDHVLKYTGIFGGVQVLKILINIIRNKLASLLLGKVGMGLSAVYSNIGELVNSSTNLGLSLSSVRNISDMYEHNNDEELSHYITVVRTWSFWTALLGALLCLACSPLLCRFFFDGDTSHILDICLLSLMVFSIPIEAGECSILKGIRQLKCLSVVEVSAAVCTLLCTIPLYYLMGMRGIVLALVLSTWSIAGCHLFFTTKFYPWRIKPFSKQVFKEGIGLAKLGIPYMVAAIFTTLSTSFVFGVLEDDGEIGLFKAGYNLMFTYAGMVFVAVEADYFPRLSAINNDKVKMNAVINQQIDVCVLLMTPLIIIMTLFMPHIIRMLYTNEFIPIAPMAVCAIFHLFFKAITLPIAYLPLAKGNSMLFLLMEFLYDAAYVALIYFGYHLGNDYLHFEFDGISSGALVGTGIGLGLAGLFDFIIVFFVYTWRYKFRFSARTLRLISLEFICVCATVPFCLVGGMKVLKYSFGLVALALSIYLAWRLLSRNSDFLAKALRKFKHSDGCDCCK